MLTNDGQIGVGVSNAKGIVLTPCLQLALFLSFFSHMEYETIITTENVIINDNNQHRILTLFQK